MGQTNSLTQDFNSYPMELTTLQNLHKSTHAEIISTVLQNSLEAKHEISR